MKEGELGREYPDGEIICRQGEIGNSLYVIQDGQVEVVREESAGETIISDLQSGDIFGEMAIIDRQPRSATVRAKGKARVLTLDKKAFLRRVHEDPSLAFQMLRQMSIRIRSKDQEIYRLRQMLSR
jgi:CRP/FNR family transcriptional regulator, cyclic AMP receptor protein